LFIAAGLISGGGNLLPMGESKREREHMIGDSKEQIAAQLGELIYGGDGSFTLADIEEIVGDGDLFEYI
jgi:hypothetical protein